jgi:hypothetical protein
MNCDWIKENVVLYIYDELADDAKYEFEHHAQHCLACRKEVESARAFKNDLAALPVQDASPNLLAASRIRLQESLESAQQSRGFSRFVFDFAGWMQQARMAPALTVALLMVGFAGGSLATYRMMKVPGPEAADHAMPPTSEADIAGIESVVSNDPNHVTIKYATLQPQSLQGSTDDPKIQQLLLLATRNNRNSGVRLDSVDVLTHRTADNAVREALVYALRYDKNPGVRLRSLDGLKSYVKNDVHVRDAVLEALMHDSNGGVRAEAVGLLDEVRADMTVREALKYLVQHDKDPFIRTQAQRSLENTPDME